ncbi:MAG: DUF1538 domain-containing protein [Clostridia bacterium]|nr:DUF1538 domain-containing protein [Clostridia bacterium]
MLKDKLLESVKSVLPICLIVAALCLLFIPVNNGLFLAFLLGTVLIIVGMAFFNIGSDLSMIQIGNQIGAKITQSKNILLILITSLILGISITIAEPDLQVLATNAPNIDTTVLIVTVSVGVGIFLMFSMLRILLNIKLNWMLLFFYAIIFALASISNTDFLSVAFDSGGVTTGPMTVPFIMALGVGVASIRSDERAKSDSFGLVALCSIGPILTVLILGLLYPSYSGNSAALDIINFDNSVDVGREYILELPKITKEVTFALLPVICIFILFQIFSLRLTKRPFLHIMVGMIYTFIGLVLFLLGVNIGFSSLGAVLGESIVNEGFKWLIVPLAMLMGWFIIKAEPAVHVLNKQVSELSAGAISEKNMGVTLSIAISIAMGLAMIRVITGISILWFMIPGYVIALALSFVVPPTFTAIAFDAGGVASGPMTATFMLPFAIGSCSEIGGNVMADAFGLVAMVAMMPLITVQIMGALATVKSAIKPTTIDMVFSVADNKVIELWEVE